MKTPDDIVIDQCLYCSIALFGFSSAYFSTEEAYKYCSPFALFWMKYSFGACSAVFGALKMYRSTAFADHKKDQQNGDNKEPTDPPKP